MSSRLPALWWLLRSLRLIVLVSGAARAEAEAPPPSVAAGAALYARYCRLCHGADATGYAADNAPSLVSETFLSSASDAFIARGIRLGRPNTAMAAHGQRLGGPLGDVQIAQIVKFLRSKGPRAVALPEVKPAGDRARGAAVYARECRSCHGTPSEPGTAPQLHNPELLASASPAFLRHAIVHGRPPTRMPAFAERLSAQQIDDVLSWLIGFRPAPAPAPKPVPPPRDDLPVVIHPGGESPDLTLRDRRFVSAEQVRRALAEGRRLIIIDARSPADWAQFHIPGAIPIPYYDTAKLARIPNDGTWVVAYCACPHHASGEVVDALRRRSFPHTAVLDEGILYWRRNGFPLEGLGVSPPAAAPGPR